MKTATEIKALDGYNGDARLYKLSDFVDFGYGAAARRTDHVVVSAAEVMFSGPETYIFAADATGEVLDWCELDGSFRGDLDHAEALRRAGYSIGEAP